MIDPRWKTVAVIDLAHSIFDGKEWNRLPVLADALMDAGCDDQKIIDDCREADEIEGFVVVTNVLGIELDYEENPYYEPCGCGMDDVSDEEPCGC